MRRKAILLALFSFFLVLCPFSEAGAAWSSTGTQLATSIMGGTASAVPDGSGGTIHAFRSYDPVTYEERIGAQRIDAEGNVLWSAAGVVVCGIPGSKSTPVIVADGAGGAIIAWDDMRSGSNQSYIQRIDSNGTSLWTADGVAIVSDSLYSYNAQIVPDGFGGAIAAYTAARSSNDILAQRFDGSGNALWQAGGVAVCTAPGTQLSHKVAPDGAGGILVCWLDRRVSAINDVYAQRVDAMGAARWTANGVALYVSPTKEEYNPVIAADGRGGAIVAWEDYRNQINYDVTCDIYASRLDSLGAALWGTSGTPVVVAAYRDEKSADIAPDGTGGAIFKFEASGAIYAQRLDAAGAQRWSPVKQVTSSGSNSVICGDGGGGAIIAWRASGVCAQRIDTTGAQRWKISGVQFILENTATRIHACDIGGGNGVITWSRSSSDGTFARRIEAEHGAGGMAEARITAVADVPADEGGLVRVTLRSSDLDNAAESIYPISTYALWQRVDDPGLLAELAAARSLDPKTAADLPKALGSPPPGSTAIEIGGKTYLSNPGDLSLTSMPPGSWELVATVPAMQAGEYLVRATTVVDSSSAGTAWAVYAATTHSTTTTVWWTSAPDSGYSVDNLAPAPPVGLAGEPSLDPEGLSLSWTPNAEHDLDGYAVYRGTSEDFVPSAGNRIGSPAKPSFFDAEWSASSGYYYKVSAIDVHDNESLCAVLGPDGVTGVETPDIVRATALHQNAPNPFNPSTAIRFDLKERGFVSLRVYDAAGRLIRVIASGERAAGRYAETWNGLDEGGRRVASGVYFCRLEAGPYTGTRKMVLLR